MRKGSSMGGVRHAEGTTNQEQVRVAGRTDSGRGPTSSELSARALVEVRGGTQERPGTAQDGLHSQTVCGEILTEQRPPCSHTASGHRTRCTLSQPSAAAGPHPGRGKVPRRPGCASKYSPRGPERRTPDSTAAEGPTCISHLRRPGKLRPGPNQTGAMTSGVK